MGRVERLLTVGQRSWGVGDLKIESLQNQQPGLVAAKVGRFLSMVVYDNEFGTKENKI